MYIGSLLIVTIFGIILGYLFGSLSWSIIIGKVFFKKDPRDFGSSNAGATNSVRIFGKKIGLIVLILDICKGILPTIIIWLIAKYALGEWMQSSQDSHFNKYSLCYLAGLSGIFGHCFPIFFKFKGGKGVATFAAFIWTISPWVAMIGFIFWIIPLLISKKVSLSSLIGSVSTLIFIWVPGLNYFYILGMDVKDLFFINYGNIYVMLFVFSLVLIGVFIMLYKHLNNIKKLKDGTESTISY